jgi:flagellar hook-associated protein 2
MPPIASFSGLASGIQWQDMIEQIMKIETARKLTPVSSQIPQQQQRISAWNQYGSLVGKLSSAARKLQNGSAFGTFSASVGTAASGRTLLEASAGATAAPGSYRVEVLALAQAEKLSGDIVRDAGAALGASGSFLINGQQVTLEATDSLNAVRDRINALNAGSTPTRVTATVLSTGPNAHRLVLTSDVPGAGGIELTNTDSAAADPLRALGLSDGTLRANTTADGRTQTRLFAPSAASLTAALGVSPPPAQTTVIVGGARIAIDFDQDTLADVHSRIVAAGGTAELREEIVGSARMQRLVVAGDVVADPSLGGAEAANSQRAVELLGFAVGGRSAIAQSHTAGNAFSRADGSAISPADTGVKLTELRAGSGAGLQIGESVTIRGTRADGTLVDRSFTIATGEETLGDFLAALDDAYAGSATAALTADGRVRLTATQGGDSRLALSLSTSGGGLAFGQIETVTGRAREVVAGSDAQLRLDGVLITRPGNTISDALAGVTLDLKAAKPGSEITLSVARDEDAAIAAMKEFVSAYNAIRGFVDHQRGTQTQPLHGNAVLRNTLGTIKNVLMTDADPEKTALSRLTLVGVSLTRDGVLALDEAKFKDALANRRADVIALAADVGARMVAAGETITRTGDGTVASQVDGLGRSIDSLGRRIGDIELRLEMQRERLISQFTRMERALSMINAQGDWLAMQIKALQPQQR